MARMTLDGFASRLAEALGPRLVTLLLYGSAAREPGAGSREPDGMNTLLLVDRVDAALLEILAAPVRDWVGAKHPAPLVLTEAEWRDSTDAFPIEYEDIREAHRVLAGRDPWHGIRVSREDVRRQLEQELIGKLIHLRQVFAAEWGNSKRVAELMRISRAGFLTMLRATLRLAGRTPPGDGIALVREAGGLIGFPSNALDGADPAGYLDAVTRTAEYVNRMERNAP
jgi:hypothetical protein